MIKQLKAGLFTLGETKHHTRILYLDEKCYVWVTLPSIGDILSVATTKHEMYTKLSEGRYELYKVKDEPDLIDLKHLELEIGPETWQGFLLLTGLPKTSKKRSRIIPTREKVTLPATAGTTKQEAVVVSEHGGG